MDRSKCLIFLKDRECTESILSITFNNKTHLYDIHFTGNDGKTYSYKECDVRIYKPEILNSSYHSVTYNNAEFTGLTGIYRYKEAGCWYLEKGAKHWLISDDNLSVSHSVLDDKASSAVLDYLKEISFVNPITDEQGNRILAKRYNQIDFVSDDSMLAGYLSGKDDYSQLPEPSVIIFPFGCNKSQKKAVQNALSNKLSIVQGPPGTGKTQTILTIIANLLLQNKTVEIVSNNNSAVDNVREKLESYGLAFLLASLGSSENKARFISSQTGAYPDISNWLASDKDISAYIAKVNQLSNELDRYFEAKETLQNSITEAAKLELESKHYSDFIAESSSLYDHCKNSSSAKLISLLQEYDFYFSKRDSFSFLKRIIEVFFHKNISWQKSCWRGNRLLSYLQWQYYHSRKEEIREEIDSSRNIIDSFDMEKHLKELSELSLKILKAVLFNRLKGREGRAIFTEEELWKTPEAILAEYPIVTSTTFSAKSSLNSTMYDYVIIDEASQCDIAAGALSLLSARNAVIVGDSKQLQNVVTREDEEYTERVFRKYSLPDAYRYSTHSFLNSICAIFPDIPSVMLREHYRCQPRIIGFCNEKFYSNDLVIMTEEKGEEDEIELFLTAPGFHSREHSNLRQAEVIAKEILPALREEDGSIGIITPYQNNVRLIRAIIGRDDIKVDTIHSFQGREMDTIIFSTSDDIVTEFSDSPMLLNVAVSRAKRRFILVASSNPQPNKSNIRDLISYISYNNFRSIDSGILSVFDLLYEQATAARLEFLSKHRKISIYDSENLMFGMLEDILHSPEFIDYGFRIVCHYPIRYLFGDSELLSDEERSYLSKTGTHADFLIYRSIGKEPVCAIEVDGFNYHKKGSQQYERDQLKNSIFGKYKLPLLRFSTNGSGEEQTIKAFLRSYVSS